MSGLGWGMGALAAFLTFAATSAAEAQSDRPWTVVVMDPLSDQLACDCVKGYAHRDYGALAKLIEDRTGRKVRIVYGESLIHALRQTSLTDIDLVIGKRSVVVSDAAERKLEVRPVALLTGKDGTTTLTGLFIAKKSDSVKSIADIKGRRVLFGPADSDEKHAAAFEALKRAGIPVPAKIETCPGCSDAALAIVDSRSTKPPIGVISSYALPLLEGCGQVPRGMLKVIGKTGTVPFVAVFVTSAVSREQATALENVLRSAAEDPKLLKALESKRGFVVSHGPETAPVRADYDWPGWRGPYRNGLVPWLPETLAEHPKALWSSPLSGPAHGGIAVADGCVVVPDRNEALGKDIFRCFRAEDGKPLWKLVYDAPGKLDFGGSPRASPQIAGGKVYLLGAFGNLHCLEISTGRTIWETNLVSQFGAVLPTWGMASSPLVVGDTLIVNPGAKDASIVALDRNSGNVLWKAEGAGAAYASLIVADLGGKTQIVGYDAVSLGGWDPLTGRRLWSIVPENPGDFNVATPLAVNGALAVATENNGTRLYGFGADAIALTAPQASSADLSPEMASPILVENRIFGYRASLICLDPANGLQPIWEEQDLGFGPYACFYGCADRLLISTSKGELLLIRTGGPKFDVVSRARIFASAATVYSHPALTGSRLYFRDVSSVRCVSLDPK